MTNNSTESNKNSDSGFNKNMTTTAERLFNKSIENVLESIDKHKLHKELKEVKNQLFWLKKYPQDDPEWSFSPSSVIKKRVKIQEREKELLDLLKS